MFLPVSLTLSSWCMQLSTQGEQCVPGRASACTVHPAIPRNRSSRAGVAGKNQHTPPMLTTSCLLKDAGRLSISVGLCAESAKSVGLTSHVYVWYVCVLTACQRRQQTYLLPPISMTASPTAAPSAWPWHAGKCPLLPLPDCDCWNHPSTCERRG